jgi:hypothetical protein
LFVRASLPTGRQFWSFAYAGQFEQLPGLKRKPEMQIILFWKYVAKLKCFNV